MNELIPQQIDQQRYQDPRKPFRRIFDDKIAPNAGAVAAVPMAAISALAQIQRKPKLMNVV